ncbi:MAG: helix-turn-helix domain-containing protein [Thermogutta sp.]|nr:helix-turn-helix domain-containing protein [Thermogutta sp.]
MNCDPREIEILTPAEAERLVAWVGPVYNSTRPAREKGQRGRGSVPSLDRFGWLNMFVDRTMRGLTHAEVVVWLCLFRHYQTKTGYARVSESRLAEQTGLSVRTVRRALAGLRRKRLVSNRRKAKQGRIAEYYLWPIAWPGGSTTHAS